MVDQIGTCERCGAKDGELRFAGQPRFFSHDMPGDGAFTVAEAEEQEEDMQPYYLCARCGNRQDHGLWLIKRQAGI